MIFNKFLPAIFILWVSLLSFEASAQDSEDYEYTREFTWGVTKNTNSGLIGGVVLKFSNALSSRKFQTFGLEIVNVKHPKEVRYFSQNTGNNYILGKSNYLYSVRGQYGREFIVFRKAPQQGIQINAHISGGPTLGVVAPYMLEISDQATNTIVYQQYDPNFTDVSRILGTAGIFRGIGNSTLNLGANIKSALVFEFGTFKNNVTGFEAGFLVEGFPKEIVLVPMANNTSLFTSAFITLFYGSRR